MLISYFAGKSSEYMLLVVKFLGVKCYTQIFDFAGWGTGDVNAPNVLDCLRVNCKSIFFYAHRFYEASML